MARIPALRNSQDAWGPVAVGLHWLVALMIVGQFVLGLAAEEAPVSPAKFDLFVWHKSFGVTILLLAALRLGWRLGNPPPGLPATIPAAEQKLARAGHSLLYVLMFAVPLSGWIISDTSRIPFRIFWSIPTPDLMNANKETSELAAAVHGGLVVLLAVVVLLHVAAALRHHFVKRNDVLLRMLPLSRSSRKRR